MTANFNWIKPISGRTTASSEFISVRKHSNGGSAAHQLSVTLSVEAMQKARFVIGDRVQIAFADTDRGLCIAVRRVHDSGFKVSPATVSVAAGITSKTQSGKILRANIKASYTEDMPEKADFADFETTDDGILLAWEVKQ